jgi:hypothetical protein
MDPFKDLLNRLRADKTLVVRFFSVFSRFEFALVFGEYAGDDEHHVKADWERFSEDFHSTFESLMKDASQTDFQKAVAYLEEEPPSKLVKVDGKPKWQKNIIKPTRDVRDNKTKKKRQVTRSRFEILTLHVRMVRNNLFHGGKYDDTKPLAPERDTKLLQSCVTILRSVLLACQGPCSSVFYSFQAYPQE